MNLELQRFFKHSSIYTIGNVLNRIGAFILLPLYTHYMGVAEYGTLELFYSTKMIIAALLSVGLAHATLRFYFEYDDELERRKVVGTTLLTVTLISVPVALALAAVNGHLSTLLFGSPAYAGALNILFAIMVLELSTEIGLAYLRAREYSVTFVAVCLVQLLVLVGCNIYTVSVLHLGVKGVLIGNLVSVGAGWAMVMSVSIRECGLHFDRTKLGKILQYSYPFLLSSICGVVINNADRFIMRSYGSMANVGVYSLAVKFGMLMQVLFLEPFNRSFGSFRFSIMKQDNTKEILAKILKYEVLGLLFLGLAISLFCKPVLQVMAAPDYWEAYKLVPFIVLAHSISGLIYFFQTGILYSKKTSYTFLINFATGLATLACNFALIPRFGPYGGAYSLIITGMVGLALTSGISQRLYPILYEKAEVIKMYAIGILLVLISWAVPETPLIALIAANNLVLLAYPALLYFFGALQREEIARLGLMLEPAWGRFRCLWQGGKG